MWGLPDGVVRGRERAARAVRLENQRGQVDQMNRRMNRWLGAAALAVSLLATGCDDAPDTTDARCAPLETNGEVSCRNGEDVMINLRRWLEGAAPSGLSLADYRTYVVNHEVGEAAQKVVDLMRSRKGRR